MNDLEIIENYVNGQLSADEKTRFEASLRADPAVADALAFYVLAKHTAKAGAREQRRAEFDALRQRSVPATASETGTGGLTRPLWGVPMRWAAAASAVLLLGLGLYFFRNTTGSSTELASTVTEQTDAYIATNFARLSTTMGGATAASDLERGVGLYNEQKFAEAETIFTGIVTRQPDNDRALTYAGITALRRANYDQAIDRFHRLSQRTDLVSNPGAFYEALAYLKRGRPMDKSQAKKLLAAVVRENLAGKNEAENLLSTMN